MKISKLLIVCLLLSLVACSSKDAKQADAEDSVADNADFIVDTEGENLDLDKAETDAAKEELLTEAEVDPQEEAMDVSEAPVIADMGQYTVEKNDTLMLIAFKIYGDYGKWKELLQHNPEVAQLNLKVGQVIKYTQPAEKFVWNPKGNPYLIKTGDTLGSISEDVYGVIKRWKDIYDNNRPMIKDPNLIFAGFTLYYIPDRDIASENF